MSFLTMTDIYPFGKRINAESLGAICDGHSIPNLLNTVTSDQLVVIRTSAEPGSDEILRFLQSLGDPIMNDDGTINVHDLYPRESDRFDRNFTNKALPLHWDGWSTASFKMDLQVYFCVVPPEAGEGETLFSNTRKMFSSLSDKRANFFSSLKVWYQIPKPGMEHVSFSHNLIKAHPVSGLPVIRFAENFSESFQKTEFEGLLPSESDKLYTDLISDLYSKEHLYAHSWKKGDIVIADNNALLHGRKAFASNRRIVRYGIRCQSPPVTP